VAHHHPVSVQDGQDREKSNLGTEIAIIAVGEVTDSNGKHISQKTALTSRIFYAETVTMPQSDAQMSDLCAGNNILFESSTNSIAFFPAREGHISDSCVVIFSAWSGRVLCGKIGGTDPLLRAGIDVFSIQSNCDDWHQHVPPAVYDELSLRMQKNYQNIYGYGSSMGGYAALLFAHKLNFHVVLAMSPQYTIVEDFDTRWRASSGQINWQYDINEMSKLYTGKMFVTYDPYDLDAQHFSLIKENFNQAEITAYRPSLVVIRRRRIFMNLNS